MHISSKFNDSSFIQHSHWNIKFDIKWKLYFDSIVILHSKLINLPNGPMAFPDMK